MRTFEEHNKITIHDLNVYFNFEDGDNIYKLFYSLDPNFELYFIFFYSKRDKYILYDRDYYNGINTGLTFREFIEELDYDYDYIENL